MVIVLVPMWTCPLHLFLCFVPCVKNNNYLFITTWLFSFPTQHSPSTINENNKYSGQNTTSRNKCREQTVPNFFRDTQRFIKVCSSFIEHCSGPDSHVCHWCSPSSQPSTHSPIWLLTMKEARQECLSAQCQNSHLEHWVHLVDEQWITCGSHSSLLSLYLLLILSL